MTEAGAPFVLIDDAGPGGEGLLLRGAVATIRAHRHAEVAPALERIRGAVRDGLHAAGFLAYEAGHALEPKLAPLRRDLAGPLLWFGLFEQAEPVADVAAWLPDPAGAWAGAPRPRIDRAAYEQAVAAVQEHILAGDIYQANLTFAADVPFAGGPAALYANIRPRARAGHGALVFTGEEWLLSFSPELFFALEGGRLTARPMKGTAVRAGDDRAEAAALLADEKQRAENLMIVDLLRNDFARVARPGSVAVPALFSVETYPTVHQMTSTVTAELALGLDAIDVIAATFPCGSITGAPKIRAMEIIDALEAGARGVYTGAIGRVAPGGEARFNVAIRTLRLRAGEGVARLGLGSGIVADSRADDEWRECLAKGAFLKDRGSRFDLIETMRFDPRDGIAELERHLARIKASADALGFDFDRHGARNELQAATFRLRSSRRVRLRLGRSGAIAIETAPLPESPALAEVRLAPLPVAADDFRLRHKTSDRAFYDRARAQGGAFETLFVDPDGCLTEGSFTHIFVADGDTLLTPPLARGLLPGVLRAALIEGGRAREADLRPGDLAGGFFIGNALRGLIRARLG